MEISSYERNSYKDKLDRSELHPFNTCILLFIFLDGNSESRMSQHSPSIPIPLPTLAPIVSQAPGVSALSSSVLPAMNFHQRATPSPSSHLPVIYPERVETEDLTHGSVHHLQNVVDRVLSAEEGERRSPKREGPGSAPRESNHTVKLPPKKAIMEEYKQEQEKRTLEERRNSASPITDQNSAVLNLSRSGKCSENVSSSLREPHVKQEKHMAVMDLSANKDRSSTPTPDADKPKEQTREKFSNHEDRKDYYPNPFSAILNLSQTYLRKLLNETPIPSPPPHSEGYSFTPLKDKENSIEKDSYNRMPYSRMGIPASRDYPADTTSKLREMLTNKGLGMSKSDSESRSGSRPSSGCASPVDNAMLYDRRPLMLSSENQHDHGYNLGLSEISPLRMNTTNMMALKQKLMDVNSSENVEWKAKSHKKRKTMDMAGTNLNEVTEPAKKKFKEAENNAGGLDLSGGQKQDNAAYPSNVDSIKTGEFPAIAIGKRHICGLCGASFTFQTNLTRHQRKLHGKPFVRKSSVGQKVEGLTSQEESMALTVVPSPPPSSLSMVKQEAQ